MSDNMADNTCPVSVIIPAYRAAKTIGRTLASIGAQTLPPKEIVIVDDGSDDDTVAAVEAYGPKLGDIALKLIQQENRGAGAARNRAVAEATQPYVAFIDADDEWLADKLARTMAEIEGTDRVLVAHDYFDVTPSGDVHCHCAQHFTDNPDPYVALYRKGYIPSCSVVARRDAVVAAGGFDESLPNAQDFELWLAMLEDPATQFHVFDTPLLRYHRTDGGIMSFTERRIACTLRVAYRYGGDIARRSGGGVVSRVFRLMVIYGEAFNVYRRAGKWLKATMIPLRFLARLPLSVMNAGDPAPAVRGFDIASLPTNGSGPVLAVLIWTWVSGTLGFYLYQFTPLIDPIKRALGLG